jgi:hypothetical protein
MNPALLLLALGWLTRAVRALGTDPGSDALVCLGYLALTAVLAGRIAERIGIPKLVGYLVLGLVATIHG